MKHEVTVGVILAGACLLGALGHQIWFMRQVDNTRALVQKATEQVVNNPFQPVQGAGMLRYTLATNATLMRVSLLSTGILVGVAFGFLGFALFVMGITGAAKLNVEAQGARVLLENAAPGLIVIVVAAMLIGVCVTQPVAVDVPAVPSSATPQPRESP